MNYSIKREDSNFLLLKLFLILSPICDLLTGICIFKLDMPEGFIGSPSQIYRLIFLFVLFFRINKRQVRICIILLLWMLFVESTCFFYINNPLPFISGLNYATKIVFLLLLYFFVKIVIESGTPILKILHVFLFAAFLYALGIIIPAILGIGVSSYTEGTFGQKGWLRSSHEASVPAVYRQRPKAPSTQSHPPRVTVSHAPFWDLCDCLYDRNAKAEGRTWSRREPRHGKP